MLNKYRKFIYIFLFFILLVSFLFNIGAFDFIYHNRFNSISEKLKNYYYNFLGENKKYALSISNDAILINTLIQYQLDKNVFQSLQQLNIYLKNYDDIKRISLFNYDYKIIITSDMQNYTLNKNIKPEWFAETENKKVYVSEIYFDNGFKTYMFSVIVPMKNFVDEIIGFLVVDIDLRNYFSHIYRYSFLNLVAYNNRKILFSLKHIDGISKNNIKTYFRFYKKFYVSDQDISFLIGADKKFTVIPGSLKIIFCVLIILLILMVLYDLLEKLLDVRKERRKQIQESIKKVMEHSKKINIEHISVIENMQQKPAEVEDEEEIKKIIEERNKDNTLGVEKDDIKKKVENEFKDDFIIIE